MGDVEIQQKAYSKVILHACKYPHCSVNGFLLAKKPKDSKTLTFVDAVPLFHMNLGLAPMLEVALALVDNYCQKEGLVIGGYYQANENFRDLNPDPIAYKVAEKIAEHFSDACLIMVNNRMLTRSLETSALILHQCQEGKWKVREKLSVQRGSNTLAQVSTYIEEKLYRSIVDFDNHFDDISLDWRNPEIGEE